MPRVSAAVHGRHSTLKYPELEMSTSSTYQDLKQKVKKVKKEAPPLDSQEPQVLRAGKYIDRGFFKKSWDMVSTVVLVIFKETLLSLVQFLSLGFYKRALMQVVPKEEGRKSPDIDAIFRLGGELKHLQKVSGSPQEFEEAFFPVYHKYYEYPSSRSMIITYFDYHLLQCVRSSAAFLESLQKKKSSFVYDQALLKKHMEIEYVLLPNRDPVLQLEGRAMKAPTSSLHKIFMDLSLQVYLKYESAESSSGKAVLSKMVKTYCSLMLDRMYG